MKLTADYGNGVVRLRSGEVCFIVDQSANTLTVRTVPKQRFCSLFTVPCDSLDLGIGKFRKSLFVDLPTTIVRREDIARKMVCLSLENDIDLTLIPVHHNA